ncbi:MAG TPA: carboxypeptidase-like regulatory domain-containing protein, partial [Planctomycetota bacterium]|nr:carboxypeptidase-like regulatory domain-containing protein [Planctomycetota bacterium]
EHEPLRVSSESIAEERRFSIDPLEADQIEVVGRVLGPDRSPLPEALVHLFVSTAPLPTAGLVPIYRPRGSIADEAVVRCDASGRFQLRADLVDEGFLLLVAEAKGMAPASRADLTVPSDRHVGAGDIVLSPESTIAGRIVDAGGAPIAGARVGAIPTPSLAALEACLADGDPLGLIVTDENGEFVLGGLAPDRYVVVAWASGHASAYSAPVSLVRGSAPPRLEIALEAGASIRGRVVSGDAAISGARVRAKRQGARKLDSDGAFDLPAATITGDAGDFVLDGLAADATYDVSAEATGYRKASASVRTGSETKLALRAELAVEGTVVDGETGAPVAGARVAVLTNARTEPRAADLASAKGGALTDDKGRFRARDAGGPRSVSLLARAAGYAPTIGGPVRLKEGGDVPQVAVRLDRGGRIAGRILGGNPLLGVQGASVALLARDPARQPGAPSPTYLVARAVSNARGDYEFEDLAAGLYLVEARLVGAGCERSEEVALGKAGRRETLDVRLPAPSVIRGTVLLGGATEPARVFAVRRDGWIVSDWTDASGRFALRELAAGAYLVGAERAPTIDDLVLGSLRPVRTAPAGAIGVDLPEGGDVTVTLEPAGSTAGRVVGLASDHGRPGAGTTIVVWRDSLDAPRAIGATNDGNLTFGGRRTTVADLDGAFEMLGVEQGVYRVFEIPRGKPISPRHAVASQVVRVYGGDVVRVDLSGRSGRLKGRVRQPDGRPAGNVRVQARVNGARGPTPVLTAGTTMRTQTGPAGYFDFGNVAGGAYDLVIEMPPYPRKTVGVDVDGPSADSLEIALERAAPKAR